jgi:hypothetical protein
MLRAVCSVGTNAAAVTVPLDWYSRRPSFGDEHYAVALRQFDDIAHGMARQVDAVDALRQPAR